MHRLPLNLLMLLPSAFAASYCGLTPPRDTGLSASGATSGSGSSGAFDPSTDFVASAWYEGWLGAPPANFSWNKFTAVTFSFATTTPDVNVLALDETSQEALPQFVQAAKSNNVKALLSIGGWTGSQYFSTAVATADNRTAFVKTVTDMATKYDLDGIDIDWEYPGRQGIGCNTISTSDSANFLSFLQLLRQSDVGKNLTLTAAVGITPFAGEDGEPMADVSDFAKSLDYIEIMNYDIWGSWSATTGPNAPVNDSCAANPAGSAVSAVDAWTAAGFPAEQISLGVPSYGRAFRVSKTNALTSSGGINPYTTFDASNPVANPADGDDSSSSTDQCGNPSGPNTDFDFAQLVAQGYLTASGAAASGMDYLFDECSQTAFLYDADNQALITYDDASTFEAKGNFINNAGLRGFSMWHATGDSGDVLVDAISKAMNIEYVCGTD